MDQWLTMAINAFDGTNESNDNHRNNNTIPKFVVVASKSPTRVFLIYETLTTTHGGMSTRIRFSAAVRQRHRILSRSKQLRLAAAMSTITIVLFLAVCAAFGKKRTWDETSNDAIHRIILIGIP